MISFVLDLLSLSWQQSIRAESAELGLWQYTCVCHWGRRSVKVSRINNGDKREKPSGSYKRRIEVEYKLGKNGRRGEPLSHCLGNQARQDSTDVRNGWENSRRLKTENRLLDFEQRSLIESVLKRSHTNNIIIYYYITVHKLLFLELFICNVPGTSFINIWVIPLEQL